MKTATISDDMLTLRTHLVLRVESMKDMIRERDGDKGFKFESAATYMTHWHDDAKLEALQEVLEFVNHLVAPSKEKELAQSIIQKG